MTTKSYNGIEVDVVNDEVTFRPTNRISKALLTSAENVGENLWQAKVAKDGYTFPLKDIKVTKMRKASLMGNAVMYVKLPDREAPIHLPFRKKNESQMYELASQLGVDVEG